jgi:hypothetical protein
MPTIDLWSVQTEAIRDLEKSLSANKCPRASMSRKNFSRENSAINIAPTDNAPPGDYFHSSTHLPLNP